MIISVETEKAFDKIPHPFMLKVMKKLQGEALCLNIMKTAYDQLTANIILTGGNREHFHQRHYWAQLVPLRGYGIKESDTPSFSNQ